MSLEEYRLAKFNGTMTDLMTEILSSLNQKVTHTVVSAHTMNTHRKVGLELHSFLTLALDHTPAFLHGRHSQA
jgi:hypothetical protein